MMPKHDEFIAKLGKCSAENIWLIYCDFAVMSVYIRP